MMLDSYYEKVINNQLKDAVNIYVSYKERFNKVPPIELFHEYFLLFIQDYKEAQKYFKNKLIEENFTEELFCKHLINNKNKFDNYSVFL